MPVLSGSFRWDTGLVWQVGFFPPDKVPHPDDVYMCPALVDTGASRTCIDETVAVDLSLNPSGKTRIRTLGGLVTANVYELHLAFLPEDGPVGDDGAGDPWDVVARIQAPGLTIESRRYKAIIGRDVLRRGVLNLAAGGHFSFSY